MQGGGGEGGDLVGKIGDVESLGNELRNKSVKTLGESGIIGVVGGDGMGVATDGAAVAEPVGDSVVFALDVLAGKAMATVNDEGGEFASH